MKYITSLVLMTLLIFFSYIPSKSHSQTEGFNVKTPTQKIADSTTKFLNNIIEESKKEPEKSIPRDLVCSSQCFLVIPDIEIVESRGDFTGTGLVACRTPNSGDFTEPLYYSVNNLNSFEESGGGLIILVTDKDGVKTLLGNYVHPNSENSTEGNVGKTSDEDLKSFVAFAKPKDQELKGYDISGSEFVYSSRDTFDAYQGTVVPIEIFVSPQDVPPVLREFDTLLGEWTKNCK